MVLHATELEPAPSPLTDEQIVTRVLAGEPALYELLMRRYNQRLFRAARAVVKDDAEAEDVMQDAYVRAWFHLAQFKAEAKFSSWITRIAINEALARLRRTGRLTDLELVENADPASLPMPTGAPGPEQEAFTGELKRLLETSIEALPIASRAAFVLRHVEGLSTTETAECLEISEQALKTRLHRARTLLREELFSRVGPAAAETFAFHAPRCDRVVAAVLKSISQA